ncbi:hypothetical protein CCICO_04470 [Corynebacterium ciconiae DSM 44920]|uniref:hypothetical protein n=1 Tax=Corynebacterium ciconiae TaxID=227319 RepID=UPI0026472857|nr:hypothetical protein [Corynebacterium ciconiae]WKD60931.1 hypothetical protein CCICO_04470 [Corynebacterium ciconiae DSM 44920]
MSELKTLSIDELYQLRSDIDVELRRREAQPLIDEGRQELVDELWAAHPDLRPEYAVSWGDDGMDAPAWVKPSSPAQGYPIGAVVSHGGHVWVSELAMNTEEPAESDWWTRRDLLPGPEDVIDVELEPDEQGDFAPVDDPYRLPESSPDDGPAPIEEPYRLPETSPEDPA